MKELHTTKLMIKLLFITMVIFLCVSTSFAQPELPQRTVTVNATQTLQFGTISASGAGGTVTVDWAGNRSSTGEIFLLATAPTAQPAIYEVKLCQGRNVIITFSAITILNGDTGGTLTLDIGPTEKGGNGVSFLTNNDCNFITPLRVGGTLHVPGTAIPGIYTGSFDITFNQE